MACHYKDGITIQLQTNVKTMQGWDFVNLPSLLYHPCLVCIPLGMASQHPFTFLIFKSCGIMVWVCKLYLACWPCYLCLLQVRTMLCAHRQPACRTLSQPYLIAGQMAWFLFHTNYSLHTINSEYKYHQLQVPMTVFIYRLAVALSVQWHCYGRICTAIYFTL